MLLKYTANDMINKLPIYPSSNYISIKLKLLKALARQLYANALRIFQIFDYTFDYTMILISTFTFAELTS